MFHLLRLFYLCVRFKSRGRVIFTDGQLYGFVINSSLEFIAKRFGFKVKHIDSIDSISWLDILTRRIKVIAIPSKELVTNLNEKWKRRAIKWLLLDVRDEVFIYWMYNLFEADYGDNVLFVDGAHIAEMYSSHLPHFHVSAISNSGCSSKVRRIFECCFATNALKIDNKFGVTVFTNTISEWIIKKYRLLHPNRKIILRFHDLLEQAGGGEGTSRRDIV